ncbi:MAG: acyltransferase [Mucilaginibacter sp.]|uniref:acyltransferase family protein n=1 Tax=Mucilaginibacter sp. TaxID=1882438 RepID=UPI0031AA95E2
MSQIKISEAIYSKYYPSLNGFRGIAIVLVVLFHLHLSDNGIYSIVFNGHLGVDIFFVLSGFLITSICIKEKETSGGMSLTSFYWRRILRIFPVAYLYILVIVLFNHFCKLGIPPVQFAGAGFYVMNFSYFRSHNFTWLLVHYWSLSVEEQFYILFPLILKINRKAFTYVIIFLVTILPFLCLLQECYPPLNKGLFYAFTHYFIKFQGIAVGCLFSILAFGRFFDTQWITTTKILGNTVALFLVFYLGFDDFYSIKAVYLNLLISLLTGYLIVSNLQVSKDIFYKLFNFKAITFVGVISYSIYIWQQLFTASDARMPNWMFWPYNIVGLIVVPLISYYFYEKYFLTLKSKYSFKKRSAKTLDPVNENHLQVG